MGIGTIKPKVGWPKITGKQVSKINKSVLGILKYAWGGINPRDVLKGIKWSNVVNAIENTNTLSNEAYATWKSLLKKYFDWEIDNEFIANLRRDAKTYSTVKKHLDEYIHFANMTLYGSGAANETLPEEVQAIEDFGETYVALQKIKERFSDAESL